MISKATDKDLVEFGLLPQNKGGNTDDRSISPHTNERVDCGSGNDQTPPISYPGDFEEETQPLREEGWQTLNFESPAQLASLFITPLRDGRITLYPWQVSISDKLAESNKTVTTAKPFKMPICAANGSGKDYLVIAPFIVWMSLVNTRCLSIITSSSGVQLTAQTENYIRGLCLLINEYFGEQIFRVRQRYIKCNLTGSEIRMFATDEAGKAEGYHPLEPGAKMVICVNEAKSVDEDIYTALRRCTGYTHWLDVSSPGEPKGSFYQHCIHWPNFVRVTSYDCPNHLAESDREDDRRELGEHSPLYRSKHLALFTSYGGTVVIPEEVVTKLLQNPPQESVSLITSVGIDIAAGGDEDVVTFVNSRFIKEVCFRETDTTIAADRIEHILVEHKISKNHDAIYADDGGIGHAVIDMLVRRGWNIKRVLNQWAALRKKQFGNRGAEMWYNAKRFYEERVFDLRGISQKTKDQITTRHYRQSEVGGRIYLESKREAKANGRPSPDRADALILALSHFTLDDFIREHEKKEEKAKLKFTLGSEELTQYYEDEITYGHGGEQKQKQGKGNVFNSLSCAINKD